MVGKDLTVRDVALMLAYLKQWVDSPVSEGHPCETDGGRQWLSELRERCGPLPRLTISRRL
jgi:hypothetical protein